MSEIILDDNQFEQPNERRRSLLPWWVKFFLWLFMIAGIVAPLGLIAGVAGVSFKISLYGLDTYQPISVVGILLTLLFAFKGVVAFGLWTEKDWAIKTAMIDAVVGIVFCIVTMIVLPMLDDTGNVNISLRLELLILIPYFLKMQKIESQWLEARVGA